MDMTANELYEVSLPVDMIVLDGHIPPFDISGTTMNTTWNKTLGTLRVYSDSQENLLSLIMTDISRVYFYILNESQWIFAKLYPYTRIDSSVLKEFSIPTERNLRMRVTWKNLTFPSIISLLDSVLPYTLTIEQVETEPHNSASCSRTEGRSVSFSLPPVATAATRPSTPWNRGYSKRSSSESDEIDPSEIEGILPVPTPRSVADRPPTPYFAGGSATSSSESDLPRAGFDEVHTSEGSFQMPTGRTAATRQGSPWYVSKRYSSGSTVLILTSESEDEPISKRFLSMPSKKNCLFSRVSAVRTAASKKSPSRYGDYSRRNLGRTEYEVISVHDSGSEDELSDGSLPMPTERTEATLKSPPRRGGLKKSLSESTIWIRSSGSEDEHISEGSLPMPIMEPETTLKGSSGSEKSTEMTEPPQESQSAMVPDPRSEGACKGPPGCGKKTKRT